MRSIWTDTRRGQAVPPSVPAAPSVPADDGPTPAPAGRPDGWEGLRGWRSLGVAIAAGLALAGAFPPAGFWPLAIAGPALLTLAVWGKRTLPAFGLGLTAGLVFFTGLLSWLVNVAWYAWATLAGLEALIFAVTVVALPPLLRLRAWPLAVAGWWVAQESIRDRFPWGGFPWGRLAMSQASAPTAGWSAIGGPPALTFLLALAGATIAYLSIALLTGRTRRRLRAAPRDGFGDSSGKSGMNSGIHRGPADASAMNSGIHRGPADASAMDSGIHRGPGDASAMDSGTHRGLSTAGRRHTVTAVVLAALTLGLVLAGNLAWTWSPTPGPSAVIATIQGNVPHSRTLPAQLRATTVTANHAAATYALAAAVRSGRRPAPDLVIWPENSTDIDPSQSALTYQTIALAVAAIDRPVLVGTVLANPVRNAGQLWRPGRGPTQQYIKRRLVPFGEVIPFRGFLELFTSLPLLQPHDFTPGHRAVVFGVGQVRLGDVICYEVGFDDLVRSEVTAGANLLAVQTNDADFELDGQQGETLQQLEMARMDAITTGRAVAVASTIGVSAIIAPDGHLITASRPWLRAELEARVPLERKLTPADRIGSWPELVITCGTGLALLWALPRRWRRRELPSG